MTNHISSVMDGKSSTGFFRFQYVPYDIEIAKKYWFSIAKQVIGKADIEMTPELKTAWLNLIPYCQGDPESGQYDMNKSLYIMGRTGSGKTKTIEIVSEFLKIDKVKFLKNGRKINFNFQIVSARQMVNEYQEHGYEGIVKYTVYPVLCIDDLGAEPKEALHYGTRLNVLSEIIEERYRKGLLTHYTTNLQTDDLIEQYDDRVHSRIIETSNIIKINDKDFRIND